jgi:hypothetical protein
MVAVSTFTWEEVASPAFTDPARAAFRQAVAQVAATAVLVPVWRLARAQRDSERPSLVPGIGQP